MLWTSATVLAITGNEKIIKNEIVLRTEQKLIGATFNRFKRSPYQQSHMSKVFFVRLQQKLRSLKSPETQVRKFQNSDFMTF